MCTPAHVWDRVVQTAEESEAKAGVFLKSMITALGKNTLKRWLLKPLRHCKIAGTRNEIIAAPNTTVTIAHIARLVARRQALCKALSKHYLIYFILGN